MDSAWAGAVARLYGEAGMSRFCMIPCLFIDLYWQFNAATAVAVKAGT